MRGIVLAFALCAGPAWAQEPMTGAEFEAYTTGKTLLYGFAGQTYGGETYRPGREVTWTFLDGRCDEGYWYDTEDLICFVYEFDPDGPVCWRFFEEPRGLSAELVGGAEPQELYEIGEADEPLFCLGPDVGV